MADQMTTDVRTLMDRDPFDASTVADIREALSRDPSRYRTLRDAVATIIEREKGQLKPLSYLKLGVASVLMGRYQTGLDHLSKVRDQGMSQFYMGLAYSYMQRWSDASKMFEESAGSKYEPYLSELHRVGALRHLGQIEEAENLLKLLEKASGNTAEFHYQRGSLLAARGELVLAASEFERTLQSDRDHTGALFELAYINDLHGHEDVAVDFYRRCTQRPPVPLAAWVNLGILLEDEGRYRDAENCYRKVLEFDPTHPRARLYMKDCKASRDQYYDEEAESRYDRLRQLLEIPVTDFELSVRSRNCLRKMNIRTLGDLTRTTEQALLASKNFGETSLSEIKEMMTSKNLRLGMALEAGERGIDVRGEPVEELSQEERAMLAKPIGDLNLSVRARKCMAKLNISTLGELINHTGDSLLECKNFGVTSLNEVREKLTELGLKLKNE